MTIILDLVDYRVETSESISPPERDGRPEAVLRIVRAKDRAFIEVDQTIDYAFALLWERAHGVPEAETSKWVASWIARLEADAVGWEAQGSPLWTQSETLSVV